VQTARFCGERLKIIAIILSLRFFLGHSVIMCVIFMSGTDTSVYGA